MQKLKCLALAFLIIVMTFFYSCDLFTESNPMHDFSISEEDAEYEYSSYSYDYDVYVYGIIKNISTKNYSSISIEYAIYDVDGLLLGHATDYIYDLPSGEACRFEAVLYGVNYEPDSYKLTKISAY